LLLSFSLLETVESVFLPSVSTSLLRARKLRSERRNSGSNINTYNEDGEIVQLRNVDIAIGNSSPIVVIQYQNGTLVSYMNPSSSTTVITSARHKFSKLRIRIVGADFVTPLMDPQLCLVVTGLAADCALAIKHTLEYVVNATHTFGVSPPGHLIAQSIADMFLKSTIGSDRPFACHAFLVDMRVKSDNRHVTSSDNSNNSNSNSNRGIIYEIEPSGNTQQVFASVVGSGAGALTKSKGKTSGYDILESEYTSSTTCDLESAKVLAEKILQHCAESSGWLSEAMEDELTGGGVTTTTTNYNVQAVIHEFIS